MNIIKNILAKNPCYKTGRTITVKGLMLHSVGCSQPSASVFIRNWNNESFDRACVHGFIDANTGDIHQTLPWNWRGWHGGGSSNNTHIGVEMCEPDCIKYISGANFTCSDTAKAIKMVERTYNSAVELFASLCKEFNLNPLEDGVIISHKEGYARGIASNHADPEHLWKGLGLNYTMNTFRRDVQKAMNQFIPYRVKVLTSPLNIRKGAGTNYSITGSIEDKGVYTIVAEKNGKGAIMWGKLKSGAGWISLDYTVKV